MRNVIVAMAIVVLGFWVVSAQANLISVARNQFGPNTVYESFEEPIDYSNAQNIVDFGKVVAIGTSQPYTFSQSGITLTAPIPNTIGNYLPQIAVHSSTLSRGFVDYGYINSSNLPPDGTHYLIEYGASYDPFAPYELTLPGNGASKVGGYWFMSANNGAPNDYLELTAYGLTGSFLGSVLVPAASVSDNDWSNNFYGFSSSNGAYIKKIGINYWTGTINVQSPGVDMLMFDPVPEPSTFYLLASAVIIFGIAFKAFALWHHLHPKQSGVGPS